MEHLKKLLVLVLALVILPGLVISCKKNTPSSPSSEKPANTATIQPSSTQVLSPTESATISPTSTITASFTVTPSITATSTVTMTSTATNTPEWTFVGSTLVSDANTAYIASYGSQLYASYGRSLNPSTSLPELVIFSYNGSAWVPLPGANPLVTRYNAKLSVDSSTGFLYCAYVSTGLSVQYYNGSTWTDLGIAGNGTSVNYSICIDNSVPYVAYNDSDNGNRVTVKKYTSGAWTTVGTAGFSLSSATDLFIGIYNSQPCVSYRDTYSGVTTNRVQIFDSAGWIDHPIATGTIYSNAMCVRNNVIYNAVVSYSGGYNTKVYAYSGSTWNQLGSSVSGTAGNGLFIYAESDSSVYLAKMDASKSYRTAVYRFNGSVWNQLGDQPITVGQGNINSMTVVNGVPYICTIDYDESFTYVKKYE